MPYATGLHCWTAAALLALFIAGCEQTPMIGHGSPPHADEAPQLMRTDAREYTTGAPVTVALVNRTPRALHYNLCRSRIERRSEDDWRTAREALAEVCTAELRTLLPGATATFAFSSAQHLRTGEYRVSTELHETDGRGSFRAISNTFRLSSSD